MKISELRTQMGESTRENLEAALALVYKTLPKAKKEELDEDLSGVLRGETQKKPAKKEKTVDVGEMFPEIGYHICKDYWRQGYAKEAASAVREWLFRNTQFDAVYSYMTYANVASYSTAASVGMQKVKEYVEDDGVLHFVYKLTRSEWEAMK